MAPLLEVRNLKKYYPIHKGFFKTVIGQCKAVDDVSFSIEAGGTFGLIGESGCGKTTVGKSILRLIEPTGGKILLDGQEIQSLNKAGLRRLRKNMQIIFQDPYGSLNPKMTVEGIIAEPLKKHRLASGADCSMRVEKILSTVGLSRTDFKKYPHEFSGGQRQRIAIARALSVEPKLIICDEPVSALDVSVQAQILNLMKELQQELHLSYLFIAHGMPVVQYVSDQIGVMYLGKLVEVSRSEDIFDNCMHPYTVALMSAVPVPDPRAQKDRIVLKGEVPNLLSIPLGCPFSNRCDRCTERCRQEIPSLREVKPNHFVACHLV